MKTLCPFCGAKSNYDRNYICGTFWQECSSLWIRKRDCYEHQLTILRTQVAGMREVLDEAINLLTSLENDYPSEGSVVRQIQDLRCGKVPKLLSSIPAEED